MCFKVPFLNKKLGSDHSQSNRNESFGDVCLSITSVAVARGQNGFDARLGPVLFVRARRRRVHALERLANGLVVRQEVVSDRAQLGVELVHQWNAYKNAVQTAV